MHYKDTLTYITCNPEKDVVKQSFAQMDSLTRHLPNTKIPIKHTGVLTTGVHIGHYFWIFGGYSREGEG